MPKRTPRRARVGRIDLGMGLFVIAVLGGVAVFGALAIGRPIRRIGEVLLRTRAGNKDVEVPYTGRRDEVGDNARAAQTFKEKLIRIEQLETRRERDGAARRRAAPRRHAGARRRVREHGRERRALGLVVLDRARSVGGSAWRDGRGDAGFVRQRFCRHRRKPPKMCNRFRSPPNS